MPPLEDDECCVIVQGLRRDSNEDIDSKVNKSVEAMGDTGLKINVKDSTRLRRRNPNKPATVKIAFGSKEEKIAVLRNKIAQRSIPQYSRVWIRSSKSHIERLLEENIRTLTSLMPGAEDYRFTGSGKLVRKGPTETPGVQMEPGPSNDSQGRSVGDEYENYSRGSHVNSRGRPWTQNSRGHGRTGGDGRVKNWQRDQQTPGRGRGAWSFGQNNQQVDYVARQKKLDYVNEPSSSGVSRPTNNQNNTSQDGGAAGIPSERTNSC